MFVYYSISIVHKIYIKIHDVMWMSPVEYNVYSMLSLIFASLLLFYRNTSSIHSQCHAVLRLPLMTVYLDGLRD